jgi:hypothetical protein
VNGTRPVLDADTALRALRALGLRYAPDLSVADGRWLGVCVCGAGSLLIAEREYGGRVSVGCRRRCRPPQEIAELLSTDPDILAARAETARWRSLACWAIESYRRSIASSTADEGADPVSVVAA